MSAAEPTSSIHAHRSTIELLQRRKPTDRNSDEFLLSAFDDGLPPETVRELEGRERKGMSGTFAEVGRRHPDRGKRGRGSLLPGAFAPGKERFTLRDDAERDGDRLLWETQLAFLARFPEFRRHPWRASPTLDVAPLRDLPGR